MCSRFISLNVCLFLMLIKNVAKRAAVLWQQCMPVDLFYKKTAPVKKTGAAELYLLTHRK